MIKELLKTERKVMFNTFRTQRRNNFIGYILACIVLLGFLYFLSKGIWSVSESITGPVLTGILSYGFLMMMGFIVLLGVPQVFKDMYSTTDLELLFTLPIPTRHIFWVKYMKSFIGVPLFVYLFFGISLFIYGIATKVSFIFYPIVLLVLLAVAIIGLSIAYLLNLILIQIVPSSRANEFMTVMSFLSGIIVYLLFMLPNYMNDEPITDVLLSGVPLLPNWVPSSWGSNALTEAASGSIDFLLPLVLLLLLAVISMVFTMSFVEKGFRTGWIRLSEGSSKKKKKRKKGMKNTVHSPITAVGKKEWFAIKRDMREWLVLMPVAVFLIFGLIGFFSGGGSLSAMRGFNHISWPVAQGILLFIYTFSNGMIAGSSIGREGSSLWILQSLPLTGRQIALGKLWISWLLPLIILTVFEIIIGLMIGWTIMQLIIGIVMKAIATVGLSAIGLWLGTIGAKYNPTNPQQRLNFGVSILLLVSSWIYLLIVSIPVAYLLIPLGEIELPPNLEHGLTGFPGMIATIALALLSWKASYPVVMSIIGVLVFIGVIIGISSLFIYLSGRKIDKGITINILSETNSKPLFGRKKSGGSLY